MAHPLICLRQTADGSRILSLGSTPCDERLGDAIAGDPFLEESVSPLLERFAALVFTEHQDAVEPLVQQLRWLAYEHGLDHVALPLFPEAPLAQRIRASSIDLGLPGDFLLMQDEQIGFMPYAVGDQSLMVSAFM